MPNTDNTRIWDALGKTDPKHTKQFTRSGGFKGTATKPIWTALRMTEYFGPCGIGWGMGKPEFTIADAGDEKLVFAIVGLWYCDGDSKGQVYGVGGDKYLIKQLSGMRASDEAFKAAYTDALSNAMKQIGVCADIHMGLFEDSKYLAEVRREFADTPEPEPPRQTTPLPPVLTPQMRADRIAKSVEATATREAFDEVIKRAGDALLELANKETAIHAALQNTINKKRDTFSKEAA